MRFSPLFIAVIFFCAGCARQSDISILKGDERLSITDHHLYFNGDLFSGKIISLENGDTTAIENYADGLLNGESKYYYAGGNLRELRYFENGRKENIHTGYYPSGKMKFSYNYRNDLFDGVCAEWYPDGQEYKKMHYTNGKESGMQQVWNSDGTLYANYEMKNNRKYGLTGTKHCINEDIATTD